MDVRILNIIQAQTNLINQLTDRIIELEKKVRTLQSFHEATYQSDIDIALENGASLDDLPVR